MTRRVPVRVRVAAAFSVAMALVLIATGVFVYTRVGDDLAHALDQDLRLRAQDVSALLSEAGRTLAQETQGRLVERGESFAQLLDPSGHVRDSTTTVAAAPLITATQARAALQRQRFIDTPNAPGLDEPARLLVMPIKRGTTRLVLAVGATRENRAEALRNLRTELLIAGPLALVLATGLGYVLAGTGLRTVEAMRARAAKISAKQPGERLPIPSTGDELQRLGETLNDMLARLEAALEQERGFVAEAGHELRTPLALLRAELDFALHYAEGEDELREAVRTAGMETDRLVQLASDLLLIASTERGEVPLQLQQLSARELLEGVRARFAWRADAEARPLALDADADLTLVGDRLRLEQALGNMVENALRYGAGTIRLTGRRVEDHIELGVHDEGPGFAPEFATRAFDRFSRGESSHNGSGAGLGLAIVSTIATAHHGTAAARNGDGGGADVLIRLPAGS